MRATPCEHRSPQRTAFFPAEPNSCRAVDNPQPVLQRLCVVVERIDQLLLRRLAILRLHLQVLLDHCHLAQHLAFEDLVRLFARLVRRHEIVLHQDDRRLARRPLRRHLLLHPEDLVAHALQHLRLALQPRHLLHLKLLLVDGKLVEDLLVGALDLLLAVALLVGHRLLDVLDALHQRVDLRLQRFEHLPQLLLEVLLQPGDLVLKHGLQRLARLYPPLRLRPQHLFDLTDLALHARDAVLLSLLPDRRLLLEVPIEVVEVVRHRIQPARHAAVGAGGLARRGRRRGDRLGVRMLRWSRHRGPRVNAGSPRVQKGQQRHARAGRCV
mmetsp:Transcript_14924/g.38380  ORF Transcript_14924/g.38380 Transcript_14924/m.38380 type:complete len:326 (+) Transcript_14924:117-1094(+)